MALPTMRQVAASAADRFSHGQLTIMFTVGADGIKDASINSITGHVQAIGLLTGETVHDAEVATLPGYAEALAIPVLGFLIPWGTIRVLTWLIVGFTQPSTKSTISK